MNVIWHQSVKPEVRAIFEPLVLKHLDLLPGWITELSIQYDAGNERNCPAQTTTLFEYRKAYLELNGASLEQTDESRERVIVHEMLHPIVEPTRNPIKYLLEQTALSATEKELLREQMRQANEGVVSDLTELVLQLKSQLF